VSRAQALVELALCLPLVLLIALGGVALVRLADARTGLDAATAAALAEAARAPDAARAEGGAQARFRALTAASGLADARLDLELGRFERNGVVSATSSARVSLGQAGLPEVVLTSRSQALVEPWRSRP
jgi:hypothetical protein